MSNENITPAAVPNALQDFTKCPEWGSGGQFIYDPATGQRTRVGDVPAPVGALAPAAAAHVESTAAEPVVQPAASVKKGRNNA